MNTDQFHPQWEAWFESGVAPLGIDRVRVLAMMVADAAELVRPENRVESQFIIRGFTMILNNISDAAEAKLEAIGRS